MSNHFFKYKTFPLVVFILTLSNIFTDSQAAVLKIATTAPDGSSWMRMMRNGAVEIEKRTAGRVKFKFYPGGIMGNDKSVLRKIRIRQLHGGAITTGSLARTYPDIQIYSLPFLFRTPKEVDYVRSRMDKILIQGLEKKGFITFGFAEGGFAYLMSNKPVNSIDDLKNQKVWVPQGDTVSLMVFQAAGITPIPLSLADVMTGLQTGLIDTIPTSLIAAIALQWHTRVKYLTDTPLSYTSGLLAIDRKAFMKLSQKDRRVVRQVMVKVFREMNRQNRLDNRKAREALKKQGIKFLRVSPAALKQWKQIAQEARAELAKKGEYSSTMLAKILNHLARYRQRRGSR